MLIYYIYIYIYIYNIIDKLLELYAIYVIDRRLYYDYEYWITTYT